MSRWSEWAKHNAAPSRGNPATKPVTIDSVNVPVGPAPGAPKGEGS